MAPLEAAVADSLVAVARRSLGVYIATVHRTQSGRPALPPAHLAKVMAAIENDALGHTLIVAPPGSAKTNTMIGAASWWLGHDPTQHVAFISNTATQGYARSMAVRNTLEFSPVFKAIFDSCEPDKPNGWSEGDWFLSRPNVADKDATFTAGGVGSPILGARFDRVILDDIADQENMATPLARQKIRDWLDRVLMTRLTPQGRVVMICTRWAEDDPAQWAIAQGWHVIHLRAIENGDSYWPEYWPLRRLACPNNEHRYDREGHPFCWETTLADGRVMSGPCEKLRMGSLGFNLMYQGEVSGDESAIFKRSWWRYYEVLPPAATRGFTFVDTAQDDATQNDYCVLATWVTDGLDFYCKRLVRKQMQFPELLQACLDATVREDPPLPLVIEETAWSKPLIHSLQRLVRGVLPFKIEGRSKLARARAVSPFVESGNCWLPRNATWVGDFVEEHAAFPNASHDDMVDTTSMAIIKLGITTQLPTNLGGMELSWRGDPSRPTTRVPKFLQAKRVKPAFTPPPTRGGRA